MGIKERRERERQATRQGILAGSRHIAQTEGWAALTIRKVAEYIEYSPSMVYEYFASKEDILRELFREGFRQLADDLRRAARATDDREERLLHIADAYWRFAQINPDLYQVMHSMGGVVLNDTERQIVQEIITIAQGALEDWAAASEITLDDPLGATELVWCVLHGLVSATMVDRIAGGEPRAHQLVRRAVQDFLTAWRTPRSAQ